MKELKELLYRETDDCTAFPVFIVMRKSTEVSQSSITHIDLDNAEEEFSVGWFAESINLKQLILDDDYDAIDTYFEESGVGYYNFENEQIGYWSKEDEIQTDVLERAFWTREEANEWCKSQRHNGDYYSYSIMAEGVLAEAMKQTCQREILRSHKQNLTTHK